MLTVDLGDGDLPDAGKGMCCMGAAARGPKHCTCWVAEYDQEQQPIKRGPMEVRGSMCVSCAYRPGSPERRGVEGQAYASSEELEEVAASGAFSCHQGVRRILRRRHPSGAVHEVKVEAYKPPQEGGSCFKANGEPADLCAGWAAEKKRQERAQGGE